MPDVRLFTREEAERTLPLVQRILADLRDEHARWREAMACYEVAAGGVRAEWGEPPELVRVREEVATRAERINGYLEELNVVGCVLKGFEDGIVDFYSLRDDRLVFLCWSLGEERITHWHEVDGGFSGRRPLDEPLVTRS